MVGGMGTLTVLGSVVCTREYKRYLESNYSVHLKYPIGPLFGVREEAMLYWIYKWI